MVDKVGFVPNVRSRDNAVQGICVAVASLVGALIGYAIGRDIIAAALGLVGGLIVGTLISGLVLMVIGLRRPIGPGKR